MAGFMGRFKKEAKTPPEPKVTEFATELRLGAGIKPECIPAILSREELESFRAQQDAKRIAEGKARIPDIRSL